MKLRHRRILDYISYKNSQIINSRRQPISGVFPDAAEIPGDLRRKKGIWALKCFSFEVLDKIKELRK